MAKDFDIVVAAENHHYHAWQAMLFHHSCQRRMGRIPIIVVHGDEPELVLGYRLIQQHGGRVQRARNYRTDDRLDYLPRNTVGALQQVESDAESVVLCDPDMIFIDSLPVEQLGLKPDHLSVDGVSYLFVNAENRAMLTQACRRAGAAMKHLEESPVSGGVPYVIRRDLRKAVSEDWLRCIRFFAAHDGEAPSSALGRLPWLSVMWALVLVVHRLKLKPVITRFCATNFEGHRPQSRMGSEGQVLMHYCYGDSEFDKRGYMDEKSALESVWNVRATPGSVNEWICAELRAAGKHYGMPARGMGVACKSARE